MASSPGDRRRRHKQRSAILPSLFCCGYKSLCKYWFYNSYYPFLGFDWVVCVDMISYLPRCPEYLNVFISCCKNLPILAIPLSCFHPFPLLQALHSDTWILWYPSIGFPHLACLCRPQHKFASVQYRNLWHALHYDALGWAVAEHICYPNNAALLKCWRG